MRIQASAMLSGGHIERDRYAFRDLRYDDPADRLRFGLRHSPGRDGDLVVARAVVQKHDLFIGLRETPVQLAHGVTDLGLIKDGGAQPPEIEAGQCGEGQIHDDLHGLVLDDVQPVLNVDQTC